MRQLPLAIQLRPEADFAGYLAGPNAEAVAAISAWADCTGEPFLYLFGAPGTGRTHLLQAACRHASGRDKTAVFLPMTHPALDPSVLEDLEAADLVALDDIETIRGNREWELGVVDLFNRLRNGGRRLLVSGSTPVTDLPFALADLRSRLGWGPGYRLRPLGEHDCEELLLTAASRRGLKINAELVGYIMRRCRREAGALLELLSRLDEESLREKRRPSVRLIRRLLDPPA
jgi:DnaA family protein